MWALPSPAPPPPPRPARLVKQRLELRDVALPARDLLLGHIAGVVALGLGHGQPVAQVGQLLLPLGHHLGQAAVRGGNGGGRAPVVTTVEVGRELHQELPGVAAPRGD